jgi:hypothetical protein
MKQNIRPIEDTIREAKTAVQREREIAKAVELLKRKEMAPLNACANTGRDRVQAGNHHGLD